MPSGAQTVPLGLSIPLIKGLPMFFTGLVLCVLALALICGGPIASIIGYNALFARLWRDNPHHPVWRTSGGFETAATQKQIVWAYLGAYGIDLNVMLTVGGLVMAIPGLYLGGRMASYVVSLFPRI